MTDIYTDFHLNEEAFILENNILKISILKNLGSKIASIYNKEKNLELLFQPSLNKYDKPKLSEPFANYDTSGIDEILPTIDPCYYPNSYRKLNDHGDIWAQKWETRIEDNSLISKVRCDSLKLDLIRKVTLKDREIKFDYQLINPTEQELYYLWAFHGLFNYEENIFLDFPFKEEIVNVINNKEYDFDYKELSQYPDGKSYKFYFRDEIPEGRLDVIFRNSNLVVEYEFDTEINKYLGVWITKGGFKGEYNFAIEPTSGYYDSLERAYKNNKASKIGSKDIVNWSLKLRIKNWR